MHHQSEIGAMASYRGKASVWAGVLLAGLCAGCVDGPFHTLSKINPVFRSQWEKDRQLGPTFVDRRNELNKLEVNLASMDAVEQQKWLKNIQLLLEHDPVPICGVTPYFV